MLGQDRLAFETPNVVDPGEQPPSRPVRCVKASSSPPHLSPTSASSTRLLRDLSEIDGLPQDQLPLEEPYDPYDDEDDEHHHMNSLPHPDEARIYAARLLDPPTKIALGKTVVLDHPQAHVNRHLVRRKILSYCWKITLLIVLVVAVLAVGIALAKSNKKSSSNQSSLRAPNAPAYTAREELITFLSDNGISKMDDLITPGTAQYQAVDWLSTVDHIVYTDTTQQIQRYVLATLFFSLNGLNWTDNVNFITNQHECAWSLDNVNVARDTSMAGFDDSIVVGVSCDVNLEVETIYLPSNALKGTLPSELQFLTHLQLLAVPNNAISGSLPDIEWSSLSQLQYFDVRYNSVSGTIPEGLSKCDKLKMIGFSNNKLKGSVPDSFATLQQVRTLSIDDNNLTGTLKFLKDWNSLEFLYADTNQLTGRLEDASLGDSQRLRQLDLSGNLIKGSIPLLLLQHPSLEVLDLANNHLTGPLPYDLTENYVLKHLSLRENLLIGPLSYDGVPKLQKLTHLDLEHNLLTGPLPNELGDLSSLRYLAMGDNMWRKANIPSVVFELEQLRELVLRNAQLTGLIPVFIDLLPNLEMLDLSHNELEGHVPYELWRLSKLRYVLLDHNSLSGAVPVDVASRATLEVVTLHKNQFVGNANPLCQAAANLSWLGLDCSVECSSKCCPSCCAGDDNTCFEGQVDKYFNYNDAQWEFNYTRPSYDFDPVTLSADSLFQIVSQAPVIEAQEP